MKKKDRKKNTLIHNQKMVIIINNKKLTFNPVPLAKLLLLHDKEYIHTIKDCLVSAQLALIETANDFETLKGQSKVLHNVYQLFSDSMHFEIEDIN